MSFIKKKLFTMTKRPRPWGDNDDDHSRLRKSHLSQKDLEKRSESAMVSVHTKTLDKLFQGVKKLNEKSTIEGKPGCESCVTRGPDISCCVTCRSMTCANCRDRCDNCPNLVCGRCSMQSPINYSSRRCLYC